MILGRAKIHHEKDEKAKKEKMDAQGFGDNHEYLRSKLKYDKNDVEGLLLGEFYSKTFTVLFVSDKTTFTFKNPNKIRTCFEAIKDYPVAIHLSFSVFSRSILFCTSFS